MIGSHLGAAPTVTAARFLPGLTVRPSVVDPNKPPAPDNLVNVGRLQDIFNPLIVLLMGGRGQGKSLAATTSAGIMRARYDAEGFPNHKILSNYPMSYADVADAMLLQMLYDQMNGVFDYRKKYPPDGLRNGAAYIDEIQTAAARMKFNARENFDLGQWLPQIRKDGLELTFTAQRPRSLDRSLLEQVDLFIECRRLGDVGIAMAVHDWQDNFIGEMKRHRPWPPFWHEADWYYTWYGTWQTFGHYPTQIHTASIYLRDKYEDAARAEWARFGYSFEGAAKEEPMQAEDPAVAAGLGRVPLLADNEEWKEICRYAGVFQPQTMWKQMRSLLPTEANTVEKFCALLRESGFTVWEDNKMARWGS